FGQVPLLADRAGWSVNSKSCHGQTGFQTGSTSLPMADTAIRKTPRNKNFNKILGFGRIRTLYIDTSTWRAKPGFGKTQKAKQPSPCELGCLLIVVSDS